MPVLYYRDPTLGTWLPLNSMGPTGPLGPTGPQGTAGGGGGVGPTGAAGPTGPTGPSGVAGTAGGIGPTGPKGAAGAAGAQGIQGPQGVGGAQGPQGPGGAQGPQGAYGDAHDRWRMVLGRTYVPGGSGVYSTAATGFGIAYNAKPEGQSCVSTSVMGSTVKGGGIDTHDTQTVWITVLRTNSTGTYVDWGMWGTVY